MNARSMFGAAAVAAVLLLLACVLPSPVGAGACTSPITACGCTISSGGSYNVGGELNGTSGATCIKVSASNVTIYFRGHRVFGGANGISGTASNVTVNGPGLLASLSGSGISLGANAQVHDVIVDSAGSTGISVGDGSEVDNCIVEASGASGILCNNNFTGATGCTFTFNVSDGNSGSGIDFGSIGTVNQNSSSFNNQYGLNNPGFSGTQMFNLNGLSDNGCSSSTGCGTASFCQNTTAGSGGVNVCQNALF